MSSEDEDDEDECTSSGSCSDAEPEEPDGSIGLFGKEWTRHARQQFAAASAMPAEEASRRLNEVIAETGAAVEVRWIDAEHGKGLFAKEAFAVGAEFWREFPLVHPLQHLNNTGVLTCGHCGAWLGTLEDAAAVFVSSRSPGGKLGTRSFHTPGGNLSPRLAGKLLQCKGHCGVFYCGEDCRRSAWFSQHMLLCTGCGEGQAPEDLSEGQALHRGALMRFEQHAQACNEALVLAARIIACIICDWEMHGRTKEALRDAKALFGTFQSPPWWDVVALKSASQREAAVERRTMEKELKRSLELLHVALLPCHRGACAELFDLEFYSRLVGMFECNNVGVEIDCPLLSVLELPVGHKDREQKLSALKPELRSKLEALLPQMQGHAFKGATLFQVVAAMNHSCEPNCRVKYDGNAIATVVALREIQAGEELCISYIDEDAPFEERREQLSEYGFDCACPRCLSQK
eukprot:TRINITY_DN37857_c0_g1_i1.p1 TRINITY_DN37857_c0_g1~~TRINITY_DN37857_c0_g1_i1.p1  ORF type:complete len:507 (+),score=101.54 TRINITY_DN37857_c0_g1_i1:140-1522(+)